jgi:hypothetical protein
MFSPSAWVKRRGRVELDAALAAAKGETHERALPGHHRSEGFDVIEGHAWMVADAALEWPKEVVVLDAITFEQPDFAVVHFDREVDDEFVLRLTQDRRYVRFELRSDGGAVEVVLNHSKEVILFRDRYRRTRYRLRAGSFGITHGSAVHSRH